MCAETPMGKRIEKFEVNAPLATVMARVKPYAQKCYVFQITDVTYSGVTANSRTTTKHYVQWTKDRPPMETLTVRETSTGGINEPAGGMYKGIVDFNPIAKNKTEIHAQFFAGFLGSNHDYIADIKAVAGGEKLECTNIQ